MMTKEEVRQSEKMESRWLNFVNFRNRKVFEKHDEDAPNWMSMIQREAMITQYVLMFKRMRKRRQEIYE